MQYLYLIFSLYFGRKNPLYYLIFPIALVSGPGALIDPRTTLVAGDIFLISSNVFKDVIIIYLLLVVLHLRNRWSFNLLYKTPMKLYGLYILILIVLTITISGLSYEAINVMRLFTHMVLGYFLLLLIFATANSRQFISFFNTLFLATSILSILYVINSAKIFPVFYAENLFQEIELEQDSFFRDFATIPYLSHLLFILAWSLTLFKSAKFNRKALLFSLITYPFVILFSFTRSLLISIIVECILIIIILAIKRHERIMKMSTLFIIISILIIISIAQTKFENEFKYFTERIDSAKDQGTEEENVAIRITYLAKAYDILKEKNSLTIGGGLNKKHQLEMGEIGAYEADSTIPFLLINTGLLGVVIYFFIGFHFLFRTYFFLKNQFNPFSLALFIYILSSLLSNLFMGGFSWGNPLVFLPFVLVMTIESFNIKSIT